MEPKVKSRKSQPPEPDVRSQHSNAVRNHIAPCLLIRILSSFAIIS
jgi:hypothetical protein